MSKKGKRDADRRKRIQAAAAKRADQKHRDHPKEFRASCNLPLAIQGEQEAGEGKLATFSGIGYTGAPMKPMGWWEPIIVDLDGVKIPSQHRPALRQHDHEQIVGHATSVKVTKQGIEFEGVFSGEPEHVRKVTVPAKNGFQWQLSIGANPIRTEFLESGETTTVNGREVTGPMTISRETELGEISFVPLGADGDTSATVSASANRGITMNKALLKAAMANLRASGKISAAKYSDEDVDAMSEDDAKAALKKCMKAEEDPPGKSGDDEPDEDDKGKKSESASAASVVAELRQLQASFLSDFRQTQSAEIKRQDAIRATCVEYGVSEIEISEGGKTSRVNLAAHGIEKGWTLDKVTLEALKASRPGAGVGVVPGGHFYSPNSPVINGAVLECAVFDALSSQFRLFDSDFYARGETGGRRIPESHQRRITAELNARYTDQVRQSAHTHFRGQIGLKQLLAMLAAQNGYKGRENFDAGSWGDVAGYLSMPVRADGASTVNTPATLANVQNKFMLQGYLFTEQALLEVGQVIPVKDLKPTKSVQLFGDFQFQQLNPGGEIQHASIGDNAYANQAKIFSRMITLELQYIINDDLGMFGQVPMMLGRGWGLNLNHIFWTAFMSPGYDDGGSTNFYAATHTITGQSANSNYQSGATTTLSDAGLKAAVILFNNQVDPAGKPLGIDPELLVYPPDIDANAVELMNAQFIVMAGLASTSSASKQANTNIWKGRFKPVMSRYLNKSAYTGFSTTAWYLLANPAVMPVIQIAALNGQMTPTIQTAGTDWAFNTLGISMRGWGGVGVNPQNFRGGVKSAGS